MKKNQYLSYRALTELIIWVKKKTNVRFAERFYIISEDFVQNNFIYLLVELLNSKDNQNVVF